MSNISKFAAQVLGAIALTVLLGAASVYGQNMSNSVVDKDVRFAKGKHETTIVGRAKYAMSYVYTIGAKEGQTMDVIVTSKNRELTFSIIDPDDETMEGAFGVTKWSGELPSSGRYKVVLVMNDEKGGAVAFSLLVRAKYSDK